MKAWYEAYRDGVIHVRFKVEAMLSKQYVFFLQHYEDQHTELPSAVQLWDVVMRKVGKEIVHNGQMDVVLALWKKELIIKKTVDSI
ncbi:hypothetical protein ACEUDN_02280 [Aeromonas hydrophila]|uniref:DUF6979 family protein n=1 Tax=Aeromonas hydrophila TaxID=644 RepID=UPI0038CF5357